MARSSSLNTRSQNKEPEVVEHYPWECISLFRKNYLSTLDFVIRDCKAMMAFCLVLHIKLHGSGKQDIKKVLFYYKQMKFQMKLEYEAWSRQLQLVSLVQYGILKTLQQKMALSCYKLKELVNDPKYNKQHRLFSKNDESDEVVKERPDEARLTEHVRIMQYQIKNGFLKNYFVE